MPAWKTHQKWAGRFLQWGDKTYPSEDMADLIDFPERKEFLLPDHDFNRRTWRDSENRSITYNAFGGMGIQVMDLHYCLDFLKEETSIGIIKQKGMMYFGSEDPRRSIRARPASPDPWPERQRTSASIWRFSNSSSLTLEKFSPILSPNMVTICENSETGGLRALTGL